MVRTAVPPVIVMVRVLCSLDCWWCWRFRCCGCCWWWFWVQVGGWRGCNAFGVTWSLVGFLCWFVVGEGVSGVVLGAGVAGVVDGVSVGSGCFRL